jgi:type I restriction-modification system DNA methylase subunit
VDGEFLRDIEAWREKLARSIALRNPGLEDIDSLNFAVQRTIDRIIFLRICEDRGLEQPNRLQALLNAPNIYIRLKELFHRADEKYNSGLFHFRDEKDIHEPPDGVTLALKIDDQVLAEIIRSIYPPCPYEFSVMPADILGQVYEQFLGKVIRLTAGHQAKVDTKPEVKKAGGVFYTPTYIVEYLVKSTVGKLLEGKAPKQAALLRILDIGCGSGSFLIGAFQYLLDWHRDWYVKDEPGKHPKEICKGEAGDWRLTISERKRILLNNIYGVDIDLQAVEVTKLSLLLKVLEGETQTVIEKQLKMFNQRALPDLSRNIKCGNSLVGHDFYHGGQLDLFTDAEKKKINAFDWAQEFPHIIGRDVGAERGQGPGFRDRGPNPQPLTPDPWSGGGFDAIVGNPPYVRQEILGDDFKEYAKAHYKTYAGTADLYTYFIERGISLLKDGGQFGYIVANKWMRAAYGRPLREWLKDKAIEEIIDFGDLRVFQGATTYPCILRVAKGKAKKSFTAVKMPDLKFTDLAEKIKGLRYTVEKATLSPDGWSLADSKVSALLEKIKSQGIPLKEYVKGKIYRGVLTGFNEAFVIDEATKKRLIKEDPKSAELIKPFLVGRDIRRYEKPKSDKYLIFTRRGVSINQYPAIENYLLKFKECLVPKPLDWKGKKKWPGRKPGSYKWYEIQDTVEYFLEFEKPKIFGLA